MPAIVHARRAILPLPGVQADSTIKGEFFEKEILVFGGGSDPTPFDLRLRLLGTSVRVPPFFWVFGVLFGYFYVNARAQALGDDLGWRFVALWVGLLLVSALAHDLGHIVMARRAGRRGQMVLGGVPSWDPPLERRRQRIAVIAAGPMAGFLFYLLALLIHNDVVPLFGVGFFVQHPLIARMIVESVEMLSFMNLFWNLLNLIPIWPLDGGEVALELFSGLSPANGYRFAFGLSALLAAGAAAYSALVFFRPGPYIKGLHPGVMAIFVGLMAIQNVQALIQAERERRGEANKGARDDLWQ